MRCFQYLRDLWSRFVMTIQQMLLGGGGIPVVTIDLNVAQTATYDLFVAIGSPAYPITVNLNVNAPCYAGITQGSGWAAGSTCAITNNAGIYGSGGVGGEGGNVWAPSGAYAIFTSGYPGGTGGDGLSLSIPTTLNNLSDIFGGGGGGGGGGAVSSTAFPNSSRAAGGGGGGGQGYNNAAGGAGGYADDLSKVLPNGNGSSGSAGSSSAVGNKGGGGVWSGYYGGGGGFGGAWGQNGDAGSSGSGGPPLYQTNPGSGGDGGYAVRVNGQSLTWVNMGNIIGTVG